MGKMAYSEQLKHPNWQRRRLEMLDGAEWTCEQCGSTEKTLHVHHRRYVKGRMAWDYEDIELQVLCEDCHGIQHEKRELLDKLLMSNGSGHDHLDLAIGLLSGFMESRMALDTDLQVECQKLGLEFIFGQIAGLFSEASWSQLVSASDCIPADSLTPPQLHFIKLMRELA